MAIDHDTHRQLYWTSLVLVLIGVFNLGLIGLTGVNILATLFGGETWLLRAIYLVIGVAGAFMLYHALRFESPATRTQTRTMRTRTF
jgi:uncharacterized protein